MPITFLFMKIYRPSFAQMISRCLSTFPLHKSLIDLYDNKKEEYSGLAFATVNRSCCENCYSSLPPQLIIDIEQQEKLVSCPSCSIFLYIGDENLAEE